MQKSVLLCMMAVVMMMMKPITTGGGVKALTADTPPQQAELPTNCKQGQRGEEEGRGRGRTEGEEQW